jgi:hypothetical protein
MNKVGDRSHVYTSIKPVYKSCYSYFFIHDIALQVSCWSKLILASTSMLSDNVRYLINKYGEIFIKKSIVLTRLED